MTNATVRKRPPRLIHRHIQGASSAATISAHFTLLSHLFTSPDSYPALRFDVLARFTAEQ